MPTAPGTPAPDSTDAPGSPAPDSTNAPESPAPDLANASSTPTDSTSGSQPSPNPIPGAGAIPGAGVSPRRNTRGGLISKKHDVPRRIRNGVRLRGKEHPQAEHWLAKRWLRRLHEVWPDELSLEGLDYAQHGQTRRLDIETGRVSARVQGRPFKAYEVSLDFAPLTDDIWRTMIQAMADSPIFVARLLSGELPAEHAVEALFQRFDGDLFPPTPGIAPGTAPGTAPEASPETSPETPPSLLSCTCPTGQSGRPCKHSATLAYLLTERLNKNPLLLFTLRGLPRERLLDELRHARSLQTHGKAAAHTDPLIPQSQETPVPLEALVDEFWRAGRGHAELERTPPPEYAPHALLRRLGPSPMPGKFPLVGLLASIYDTIAESATKQQTPDPQEADPRPPE